MKQINFFIYGLSGSGKDTISNYLCDKYGFTKLRIANTIKSIICETENLTFDELEEQKRNNPKLRQLHHKIGKILETKNGTNNRIKQLINGTSLDYQFLKNQKINKVICDCRCKKWSEKFLNAGWIGIFLNRTGNEYRYLTSFTEQNMFLNGEIEELLKIYGDQIYLIYNDDNLKTTLKLNDIISKNTLLTDGSEKELLMNIDRILCDFSEENEIIHNDLYYDTERNKPFPSNAFRF